MRSTYSHSGEAYVMCYCGTIGNCGRNLGAGTTGLMMLKSTRDNHLRLKQAAANERDDDDDDTSSNGSESGSDHESGGSEIKTEPMDETSGASDASDTGSEGASCEYVGDAESSQLQSSDSDFEPSESDSASDSDESSSEPDSKDDDDERTLPDHMQYIQRESKIPLIVLVHVVAKWKTRHKASKKATSDLLQILKWVCLPENIVPTINEFDQILKTAADCSGERFDVCPDECVIFKDDISAEESCPECNADRRDDDGSTCDVFRLHVFSCLRILLFFCSL
jgi:hypothetical protein